MMISRRELAKKLAGKHILFDTGVIIHSFQSYESFVDFFILLIKLNCHFAYFPLIEFEFIRGAYEEIHRRKRQEFLRNLSFLKLPFQGEDLINDAIRIANIYAARRNHKTSLVDCLIAAYLRKYSRHLILVTTNHQDFPTYLFDRLFIYPIDTEKDIITLAFYKFDQAKAQKLKLN